MRPEEAEKAKLQQRPWPAKKTLQSNASILPMQTELPLPPKNEQDFEQLSYLDVDVLQKLPLTRAHLKKIMEIKDCRECPPKPDASTRITTSEASQPTQPNDLQHQEITLMGLQEHIIRRILHKPEGDLTLQDFCKIREMKRQNPDIFKLNPDELRMLSQWEQQANSPQPSQESPSSIPANQAEAASTDSSQLKPMLIPTTREDFEQLTNLSDAELSEKALTRSDLAAVQQMREQKKHWEFSPLEMQQAAEKFAQVQELSFHQPLTDQDFEILLKLEKWQIACLPLTLQDRQKLFHLMQERGLL